MQKKIMVLGDFNPAYYTHLALNDTIGHLKKDFENQVSFEWIPTDEVNIAEIGSVFSGLYVASGSPYKNGDRVLAAIQFARENNIPSYGNCGGYQHMIIEFARNVCLIADADTEETNPAGISNVISSLSCSLVGEEEDIHLDNSGQLFTLIHQKNLKGKYHCNYALNENYKPILESHGMKMTAFNSGGDVRAFELSSHPFFIGTLFQPALTSTANAISPILVSFVKTVLTV